MVAKRTTSSDKSRLQGTYILSRLEKQEVELARLQKQAGAMPEKERQLMVRHGLRAGMKVLDAACGPGITSGLIHDLVVADGGSVTGLDQDPDLLRIAKGLARNQGRNIHFVQGDVYALPFEREFDYVYCRFLFQHLEDPAGALLSLTRVLKPGGILHLVDVNDEWLFLQPRISAFDELCHLARHYQAQQGGNRLIGKELRSLMLTAGLSRIETDVIMVNSDLLGLENFLELTTYFKREIVRAGGGNPDPLLTEIRQSIQIQETFGACGIFSVSGIQPP